MENVKKAKGSHPAVWIPQVLCEVVPLNWCDHLTFVLFHQF